LRDAGAEQRRAAELIRIAWVRVARRSLGVPSGHFGERADGERDDGRDPVRGIDEVFEGPALIALALRGRLGCSRERERPPRSVYTRVMRLEEVRIRGYRSLRDTTLPLARLTVVLGANGSGKTNLYRAMQITAAAASGTLGRAFAEEGGMPSVLWAGSRVRGEGPRVSVELRFEAITYALTCIQPNPAGFGFASRFLFDPIVEEERVGVVEPGKKRPVLLLDRGHQSCMVRGADGTPVRYPMALSESESVLSQIAEPHLYPELSALTRLFSSYRYYHHFRSDQDSPLREPQVGTRTPILAHDGSDLAAAIVTLQEIGDAEAFAGSIERAFPGSKLVVDSTEDGRFVVTLTTPGVGRPLQARELSDGTLRYVCLVTALLSPHPAPVLVLNEPETSLHPDLLSALVDPIVAASERSQVLVLTHGRELADALVDRGAARLELSRVVGATTIR
jgi:predicted ATPase